MKNFIRNTIISFKDSYRENKIRILFEIFGWLLLSSVLLSINLFSVRMHYLPIILSVIFAIFAIIYILFFGSFHLNYTIGMLLVFLIYACLVTLIFSRNFSSLKTYITVISLSFIMYEFLVNSFKPRLFCFLFIFAAAVLALAFLIYYRNDIVNSLKGNTDERMGSFFGGINFIANTFLAGIVMCFAYMLIFKKFIFASFSALLIFFCILATGSKTPLLGSLISFIAFIFLLLWKKHKILLAVFCIILVIAIIVFFSVPWFSSIRDRIVNMFLFFNNSSYDASTYNRFIMLISGLEYWLKNLFFGVGAGGFSYVSSYTSYSHSTISEILCDFGLVGTILYFYPLCSILFKSKKGSKSKTLSLMLVLGFVLIGLVGTVILGYKVFYLFLAVIYACFTKEEKNLSSISISFNFKRGENKKVNFVYKRSNWLKLKREKMQGL